MKTLLATLGLTLALAQPASAYFITCGTFKAAVVSGDPMLEGAVGGHAFGVADFLAQLLCFGRDRRCNCLSNLNDRAREYGTAVGNAVANCPNNDPAAGVIFNAALQVCR